MTGRLLAGTSVVALAIGLAAGAAQAQDVEIGAPGQPTHIIIQNFDVVVGAPGTSDFLNNAPLNVAGVAEDTDPAPGGTATSLSIAGANVQFVNNAGGDASVTGTNTDVINVTSDSTATATGGGASTAFAAAIGFGSAQGAIGDTASTEFDNQDTLNVETNATATADDTALAIALGVGIAQAAIAQDGDAFASIENSSLETMNVHTTASAEANVAIAAAISIGGVQVVAATEDAHADLDNSGTYSVTSEADAKGGDLGVAIAVSAAHTQLAIAGDDAKATADNSGEMISHSEANATATDTAVAIAASSGLAQIAIADDDAEASFVNSGSLDVKGDANAVADNNAFAAAIGLGVTQVVAGGDDAVASIDNSSVETVNVHTTAYAEANNAFAATFSSGGLQIVAAVDDAEAHMVNSGEWNVSADSKAVGGDLAVAAAISAAHTQFVIAGDDATATADNSGNMTSFSNADASADEAGSTAVAIAASSGIAQIAIAQDEATADAVNSGSLHVDASAKAVADDTAVAAAIGAGVTQIAVSGNDAFASFENSSDETLEVHTTAYAEANNAIAAAISLGGLQVVISINDDADAVFTNTGRVEVTSESTALGGDLAVAAAISAAHSQVVIAGDDATATATNEGTIIAHSDADATATEAGSTAVAAAISSGLAQVAVSLGGDAIVTADNLGTVDVQSNASATAKDTAVAAAIGLGITQIAIAEEDAIVSATNSGNSIVVETNAQATADNAIAVAASSALAQVAVSLTEEAHVTATSDGLISSTANADADGDSSATAAAVALGVTQLAVAPNDDASASFSNNAELTSTADAHASAPNGTANAFAAATGSLQIVVSDNAEINYLNTDRVTVSAKAVAEGDTENAIAIALGAGLVGIFDQLTVDFLNDHGKIHVTAYAEGDDVAIAAAFGVLVVGNEITEESMIVNRGEECCDGIFVEARAVGENGEARASGIEVLANAFDGTIINDRAVIKAYAEVDNGKLDDAEAFGIRVSRLFADNGTLGTIINNGGQIWAGISDDGGATIHRGVAIETRDAPNPMDILLMGEEHWGNIFGHINISDDDTIVVSDGVTSFDGIVNSDGNLFGEMTVADGGIFFMRLNEVDGASQVNVREFTQEPDGTIWFEINATPFATAQAGPPDNFIGQINGDIVELAGTATLRPRAGIYQNFFVYEEVVTAQTSGTGEWDEVNSTSPLLDPEAVYNPGGAGDWDTVDIEVTRIAFDAVAGLTKNQASVGGGIEAVYPDLLAGVHAGSPFETLVGTLFTLNDVEYPDALRQLSGAEHAQGLWSVTNSLDLLKRAENARSKYGGVVYFGPPVVHKDPVVYKDPVVMADPVPPARGALWVNAQGAWAEVDGDQNAPGFDHDRASIHAGVDYMIMPYLTLGLVGGYFSADLDFDTGSSWDYDGFQIGGYGKYEWEQWYVNGIIGYGNYDGKSRREIAFGPTPDPLECDCFADPNDFLTSVNRGKFDAHAWMISGEVGHRFQWSETGWVAPYIGVTYQQGDIDSFTETAVGTASGSALRVRGKGDSLVTDLGVRLAHSFMVGGTATANAELRVAWLHEFGDSPHDVNMNFAGIAGSNFKIVGSKISRDTFAVDPGLSVDVTDQLRLGFTYHGRFNSDFTEHGVMGRAIFHF